MSLTTEEIIALGRKHLLGNVNRYPVALVRGRGTKVWDAGGREYLDFIAGIATCAFGHAPEFAGRVLAEQAEKLWHVSNLFWNEPLVRLAELLTKASGLDKAFFCNSGAEANEGAIKMARKWSADKRGPGRHVIVAALNSFHGRTMGAISATGQENLHKGFEPMLPGFRHVPYGDLEALKAAADGQVCAVLLEPVQGEGGVLPPPEGYLQAVEKLCRERDVLLVLDEIQTGLGRTGLPFAFQHFGLRPDIVTLGKALGCGYPSGAMLSAEEPSRSLGPGTHSTTVGGAPLAMALGLELVSRILDPKFLENVRALSARLTGGLEALRAKRPDLVLGARGLGLMLGLQLAEPAGPAAVRLREKGFLVNATAGTVLRFVPPLNVLPEEIDLLLGGLEEALNETYPRADRG
ncbi:MAG: acetylornithine/succinylornithine family transaminase [Deltaproteobacteria bacterium]|jgi:predicted acetylornithine/succinylornithine family transaminase|nr:acetylornithine/succinylornithine family transaminase [Deltaproteobacteria bacterium]